MSPYLSSVEGQEDVIATLRSEVSSSVMTAAAPTSSYGAGFIRRRYIGKLIGIGRSAPAFRYPGYGRRRAAAAWVHRDDPLSGVPNWTIPIKEYDRLTNGLAFTNLSVTRS